MAFTARLCAGGLTIDWHGKCPAKETDNSIEERWNCAPVLNHSLRGRRCHQQYRCFGSLASVGTKQKSNRSKREAEKERGRSHSKPQYFHQWHSGEEIPWLDVCVLRGTRLKRADPISLTDSFNVNRVWGDSGLSVLRCTCLPGVVGSSPLDAMYCTGCSRCTEQRQRAQRCCTLRIVLSRQAAVRRSNSSTEKARLVDLDLVDGRDVIDGLQGPSTVCSSLQIT